MITRNLISSRLFFFSTKSTIPTTTTTTKTPQGNGSDLNAPDEKTKRHPTSKDMDGLFNILDATQPEETEPFEAIERPYGLKLVPGPQPDDFWEKIVNSEPDTKVYNWGILTPLIAPNTYLDEGVNVVGDVGFDINTSVWKGAQIYGDQGSIMIHHTVAIGENTLINTYNPKYKGPILSHVPENEIQAANEINFLKPSRGDEDVIIGSNTVIGDNCKITSATIGYECTIGDNTVIEKGAVIGHNTHIAPNSYIPAGKRIGSTQLWAGNEIQYIRELTEPEQLLAQYYANRKYEEAYEIRSANEPGLFDAPEVLSKWIQKLVRIWKYEHSANRPAEPQFWRTAAGRHSEF